MKKGEKSERYNLKQIQELERKKGKRLQECRKRKGLTQEELAEKAFFSTNYVSMLERGTKAIDWDKAIMFSKLLDISPSFLMCETDIMKNERNQTTYGLEDFGEQDCFLIKWLSKMGHEIVFHVIKRYAGERPATKTIAGRIIKDWSSLHIAAYIDELQDFCLSDGVCKLSKGGIVSEVVIHEVSINGCNLTYGKFVYLMECISDFANGFLDGMAIKSRYAMIEACNAKDSEIENTLEESRWFRNGLPPTADDFIDEARAAFGDDIIGRYPKNMKEDLKRKLDEINNKKGRE